jgi:hypothetical protein
MSVLAVEGPRAGAVRKFLAAFGQLLGGLAEGIDAAHRYERLSSMSDAELRQLGIGRQDVAWFALYGEPRPR